LTPCFRADGILDLDAAPVAFFLPYQRPSGYCCYPNSSTIDFCLSSLHPSTPSSTTSYVAPSVAQSTGPSLCSSSSAPCSDSPPSTTPSVTAHHHCLPCSLSAYTRSSPPGSLLLAICLSPYSSIYSVPYSLISSFSWLCPCASLVDSSI
jgi:hypothetical protein